MNERYNLAFLNFIRIFLAISITFWHCVGCQFGFNFENYRILEIWRYFTVCGGNQVFFLISGMTFFLAYYPKLSQQKLTIKKFLAKRAIKIYPLATAATLFAFLIAVLRTFMLKGENSFSFNQLFLDLVFFGNTIFRYGYGFYNGPIWYLASLFFCYLVAALIISLTRKKPCAVWFVIPLFIGIYICEAGGTLPFFNNFQLGMGLYNFFSGFFFMPILQRIIRLGKIKLSILRVVCFLFACATITLFIKKDFSTSYFGNGDVAFNLVIWMPLFIALYGTKINALFYNKFFDFLGELSFSIYVIHIALNAAFNFTVDLFNLDGIATSIFLIYYAVLAVVAISATWGFKRLGKALSDKLFTPSEQPKTLYEEKAA